MHRGGCLFHTTYGLRHETSPTLDITPEEMALRHKLMAEENDEYLDAVRAGDMLEVADALGDMLYILCGTMVTHGMQGVMSEVFRTFGVQHEQAGEDGKPIYREDGKVMKGPTISGRTSPVHCGNAVWPSKAPPHECLGSGPGDRVG